MDGKELSYSRNASSRDACRALNINPDTLRKWESQGKIDASRTASNQRRYNLQKYFYPDEKFQPTNYIYARVSTASQKEDLERQISILQKTYPEHKLIKDVGSGLSFKRKGLTTLVGCMLRGEIGEIVVTHRDRLSRFGFELLELILRETNPEGKIVVLYQEKCSPEKELTDDLLAILTVFSSRLYGLRSHKNAIHTLIKDQAIPHITNEGGEEKTE